MPRPELRLLGLALLLGAAGYGGPFTITLNPGAGILANAPALAAFDQAASFWESVFADPINVNLDVNMADLGNPNIIGSASTSTFITPIGSARSAMVFDAAASPETTDDINAFLPVVFSAYVPAGYTLSGNVEMATANAKALGFATAGSDGAITFNSTFSFYYGTDTPPPGQMSFYSVAVHEIAHALGFISAVDIIDEGGGNPLSYFPLDYYRFRTVDLPATPAAFSTNPRFLVPGFDPFYSDVASIYAMSSGRLNGDGRQASHWKADESTGIYIGIMDPTLAYGVLATVTSADVQALNVIGWDVAVPEPGAWLAMGSGLILLAVRRRRARRRS